MILNKIAINTGEKQLLATALASKVLAVEFYQNDVLQIIAIEIHRLSEETKTNMPILKSASCTAE